MTTDSTSGRAPAISDKEAVEAAHSALFDMEMPLISIEEATELLFDLAEKIEGRLGCHIRLVLNVVWEATTNAKAMQSVAWRATHSRRAHFERVGWPSEEVAA